MSVVAARTVEPGPHDAALESLYEALLAIKTRDECARFLKDLTTPAELRSLSERWQVAQLLEDGELSYREIHDVTGVSTTTITRVARFLTQESNRGYRRILDRLKRSRRAR